MGRIRMMYAKLHGLRVTEANVNYVGSITIDCELLEQVGMLPLQEVEVWNASNGHRLSTYLLPGKAQTGIVCLNGAAAHLCQPGDVVIVAAYEECDRLELEVKGHEARVLIANGNNRREQLLLQTLAPQQNKLHFESKVAI